MKQKYLLLFLMLLVLRSVAQDCHEHINTLPMYGRQKKCKEQLKADDDFFSSCDKEFKSRKEASKYYTRRGWDYFTEKDYSTAMKRFNQAWMLDSTNASVYWGFADISGTQQNLRQALPFFERAIALGEIDNTFLFDACNALFSSYRSTGDTVYLHRCVQYLNPIIAKERENIRALARLTTVYAYFPTKDSALKYLRLTDSLDSKAIDPALRNSIMRD